MRRLVYEEWIERERRVRTRLLMNSPLIRETHRYRVCTDCGEICLCHENPCPNCHSGNIVEEKLDDTEGEVLSGKRIRCEYRFARLLAGSSGGRN